ncbi:c-type cytochrome [Candidatus Methylacidithermus pantelleriae]|uniref:Nitric oxide reductase, subunit C n=1 Tax=Candidatus Methylacidithermus pantelleriae TaxID=2744239 RepID=A0A8J2BRG5_9BACT|nr:cytochrome c [Candidatus Methylacidithermus pantelleriae]CAF0701723.1 Nitric oxide reductase, subunit C [Candidatus Methylacidithermus pantelleriae]
MEYSWIEITVAALFLTAAITLWISRGSGWLSWRFWRNAMVVSSLVMSGILLWLTVDTVNKVRPGAGRVPPWTVINHEIGLQWDPERRWEVPVIGKETGFFGKVYSPQEAYALINKGKLTIQSRNCMECHTLLGNGAYFAPDLTRSWLDPWWKERIMPIVGAKTREAAMKAWLINPPQYPQGKRIMPNLGLTDEELTAVVAFLKWMSAINTNGFPPYFGQKGRTGGR